MGDIFAGLTGAASGIGVSVSDAGSEGSASDKDSVDVLGSVFPDDDSIVGVSDDVNCGGWTSVVGDCGRSNGPSQPS